MGGIYILTEGISLSIYICREGINEEQIKAESRK